MDLSLFETKLIIKALMDLSNCLREHLDEQIEEVRSKKYVEGEALADYDKQSIVITKVNETILKFALHTPASKEKDEILKIAAANISQAITTDSEAYEQFIRSASQSHEWN
jgi:hypothetical protein